MPLDLTDHLLHQATLPSSGYIAALPNTWEQTQGGCQNKETEKHVPNGGREQNSRKRTKQNKDKQSIRCRFKQVVIRMLREHSENFNNIKKDMETIKKNQSETVHTLTEMKNNLQGINSTVDEAKNQISGLEYKKAKITQSEQQKRKRILQDEEHLISSHTIRSIWGNFKHTNICITGVLEEEERKKLKTYLKK